MKHMTNGHGTLRQSGALTELCMMDTAAYAVRDSDSQMVRIVMIEKCPGGAELDVKLSAEDAAHFASAIYALARSAIIQNEREATKDTGAPGYQAAA